MSFTIWLCGWPIGTLAIYKSAVRKWRNPTRRRQWLLPRTYATRPAGIIALALSALALWWLYVLACPLDMWHDSRWIPDEDGDDDA